MSGTSEVGREPSAAGSPLVTCEVCGSRVPPGAYCGACGSHLSIGAGPRRLGAYAADPQEHVLRPGIVSTLFPHLPHRSALPFRLALLNGALILVLFGLLRLAGPAFVASALLMPVLYLLYLYEVGLYEDQPWLVISTTLLLGTVLGVAWAALAGPFATQALVHNSFGRFDANSFVIGGVLVPLAAQGLMLLGPALLSARGRFEHALDGFTFGVAAALGFSLGATLAVLPGQLSGGAIVAADPLAFALEILRRGLLSPLISASLTGLIAAAFWLHRQPAGLRPRGWIVSRTAMIVLAVIVQVGLGILDVTILDQRVQTLLYAVVAFLLIILARIVLHTILLAEAHLVSGGPVITCPQCHRLVPRMPFCPYCGIARRATPKIGRLEVRPHNADDGSVQRGASQ